MHLDHLSDFIQNFLLFETPDLQLLSPALLKQQQLRHWSEKVRREMRVPRHIRMPGTTGARVPPSVALSVVLTSPSLACWQGSGRAALALCG